MAGTETEIERAERRLRDAEMNVQRHEEGLEEARRAGTGEGVRSRTAARDAFRAVLMTMRIRLSRARRRQRD